MSACSHLSLPLHKCIRLASQQLRALTKITSVALRALQLSVATAPQRNIAPQRNTAPQRKVDAMGVEVAERRTLMPCEWCESCSVCEWRHYQHLRVEALLPSNWPFASLLFAFQKINGEQGSQDLANNFIVQKWWDFMADIMEVNPDNSPISTPLEEVFYLKGKIDK